MRLSSLLNFPSMKKPRVCQICNRTFANGKAMGGHMRSHLAKLPLPPKPKSKHEPNPIRLISSIGSPSSAALNEGIISAENPNRREVVLVRSFCHGDIAAGPKRGIDKEIETELQRNLTRKRSERQPRRATVETTAATTIVEPSTSNSVSSMLSQSSPDEDAALCLLKLWKEKWPEGKKPDIKRLLIREPEEPEESEEDGEEYKYEGNDEEDEDDLSFTVTRRRKKSKGKYKCETCDKVFRSYQALGGHRASHKNKRVKISGEGSRANGEESNGRSMEHRSFRCPFCDKVFDSGQALGGHKKVHLSYLGISKTDQNISNKSFDNTLLDLNLPAPVEEE